MYVIEDSFDDFWDVSKLVPKKKPSLHQFSSSASVNDVIIDAPSTSEERNASDRKIDFEKFRSVSECNKEIRSYIPSNSKLIQKVTVKPSYDRFDFYDTFRKAALIYYDYKCAKCDFVPFYSYKPQYSQMTTEQKKYYFFWRDELRAGRYLKTDYSYIYLFVYEVLNLPEKIGPEYGLEMLCDIWNAYRRELPRIDSYFALWIQDYCLVWELECPFERIKDFLFDVIEVSSFKEFYLADLDKGGNGAAAMIAYLSDYDWRKCKYASGDNAQSYRAHIEGAMQLIFSDILSDDMIRNSEITKLTRNSFQGSLCTHSVKSILEIEYYSIADSAELRKTVTSALRYTENKLRACLGVKSRLSIANLPERLKNIIDAYFDLEFKRLKREKERINAPEYEKLYDAPENDISFENALEIERASWATTARLIEDMQIEEDVASEEEKNSIEEEKSELAAPITEARDTSYGLTTLEIAYLRAVSEGKSNVRRQIVKELSTPEETVVERINEAFADNFGDVILEVADNGEYMIIDDYFEEITEWLRSTEK